MRTAIDSACAVLNSCGPKAVWVNSALTKIAERLNGQTKRLESPMNNHQDDDVLVAEFIGYVDDPEDIAAQEAPVRHNETYAQPDATAFTRPVQPAAPMPQAYVYTGHLRPHPEVPKASVTALDSDEDKIPLSYIVLGAVVATLAVTLMMSALLIG